MNLSKNGTHSRLVRAHRYQAPTDASDLPLEDPSGARVTPGHGSAHGGASPDMIAFGMKLFLASLTMIFGATFVAYGIFRWRERLEWESIITTREILGLAAATILLVVADIASMRALKKADTRAAAARLTWVTAIFASVYMVVQAMSWVPLLAQVGERINGSIVGGTLKHAGGLFLMVTFAHAIHVLGGVIANAVVLMRSTDGRGPNRDSLRMLYSYWRFLTVMWIAVLAILFV
ncbi:MAG: heme/copper-type cytochrome/quinol oxidase subunit 3 [Paracoccaceae bacterium]|jgi:heme/copper-type cytochrome/quinol oxidase subunit 3